ncbi:MAG: putative esterase [Chloroflexi bacterium]|nr:putative esterase [Chloroflexota bacterium]
MSGRGQVVIEEIDGPSLENNPLGDPTRRTIPIYLPPSYREANDRRYPTIYALPGLAGTGLGLLNASGWEPNLPARMDRLISSGQSREMILVMVDAFTKYGGSQFINSEATGRYEDFVTEDLVSAIDGRFRTIPDRDHRGVMGKSSGGYGAFVLAMRHPDIFGACACHSGDMYFEYCYHVDFPRARDTIERDGGVVRFWEKFFERPKITGENFAAVNTLCMASCYSANLASPYGYDLPFDERTGEIRREVWQRWVDQDPVYCAERYVDNLRSLRLLFVDCGTRDQYTLHMGARILADRLKVLGIPHVHEEFDDNHSAINYRCDVSIPRISSALANP